MGSNPYPATIILVLIKMEISMTAMMYTAFFFLVVGGASAAMMYVNEKYNL